MKKIYLPILATLLVFSSCQCNKNQSGTTTTSTTATASTGVTSGQPTSAMIPPSLTGGHAGNFTIQMNPTGAPPACNRVHIFVYFPSPFNAAFPQQVTVTSFAPNPTPMTFTDVPGNPGGAISVAAGTFGTPPAVIANTTGNPMTVTVAANVNGLQYTSAPLQPLVGANDGTGLGIVTYSDGAGHQAVIMAEDEGVMQ
jgi:hypothetical protein